ncbi:MAG: DUF1651 domain-containing protein [Prochlorococcaceae cyanobacterium]
MAAGNRPPLSPNEGWLSNGRQVLHFRPTRWSRHNQVLEVTSGELLPGEPVPLLKRRGELTREEALRLWAQKRREGWQTCPPQWTPPAELKPPARRRAGSMGATGLPPCF